MLRPRSGRGSRICREKAWFPASNAGPADSPPVRHSRRRSDCTPAGVCTDWLMRRPLIPQIAQQQRQRLFDRRLRSFVGNQNQQIDIGVGKQLARPYPPTATSAASGGMPSHCPRTSESTKDVRSASAADASSEAKNRARIESSSTKSSYQPVRRLRRDTKE